MNTYKISCNGKIILKRQSVDQVYDFITSQDDFNVGTLCAQKIKNGVVYKYRADPEQ